MRVAMLAYAYYEGNSRIKQYAEALAERGDSVDVICIRGAGDGPDLTVHGGISVHRIQRRALLDEGLFGYAWKVLLFWLRASLQLTRMHLKARYDIVHVHSVPDFLVLAAWAPKLSGTPIILDVHDILPEFYAAKFQVGPQSIAFKLMVLEERVSVAFSDHVIAANPIWRERLLNRSAEHGNVTAIGNYPDRQIFFLRPKQRRDQKFIITYPGSLNWHQGVDIAVRALARVATQIPEAELHIYGEGPQRANLETLARELGMESRVTFSNFLPMEEVVLHMADSDLAVVPKRAQSLFGTEAASTKIMEFMCLGVPLVISRTKIDSLYHSDATVQFYDNDDPDELAEQILKLYRDPALRKQLAANALAYARQRGWSKEKETYLCIVDTLAGRLKDATAETCSKPVERATEALPEASTMTAAERSGPSISLAWGHADWRLDRLASVYLAWPMSRIGLGPKVGIPILMYHAVQEGECERRPYFETKVKPEVFAQQMRQLSANDYRAVSIEQAIAILASGKPFGKTVVLTFDDGYCDFYDTAFPLLSECRFTATVFVMTGYTRDEPLRFKGRRCLSWREVRELHSRGIHFGAHTVTHPQLRSVGPKQIEEELAGSKKAIEDHLGTAVRSFCYPFAFPEADRDFRRQVKDSLIRNGYENGVTTILGLAQPGCDPFFLPRLPVNTWDDPRFFQAKLEGAYDWLHGAQYFSKRLADLRPRRHHRDAPSAAAQEQVR